MENKETQHENNQISFVHIDLTEEDKDFLNIISKNKAVLNKVMTIYKDSGQKKERSNEFLDK